MKLNKIIVTICVTIFLSACNTLDVPPMNIVTDKDVFNSESGITGYFSRLYRDACFDDYKFDNAEHSVDHYTDLLDKENLNANGRAIGDETNGWWNYVTVRDINYFIQEFPKYQIKYTLTQQNTWMGECYFLRAWAYFSMCRRYGGVPIVDKVLDYKPGDDIEALKLPRNKEVEVIDFIIDDLNKAIALLDKNSMSLGRVNKYVAYAFKARVALYAASIAKYGTPLTLESGVLGIPAVKSSAYYDTAYTAAKIVIDEGGYSLYPVNSAEDYTKIFLDKGSRENIFIKQFNYPDYGHDLELKAVPWSFRGPQNYSGRWNPSLNYVALFVDTDGNPMDPTDPNSPVYIGPYSNPNRFDNRMDLFNKAEYRLAGSVIFPGADFKGRAVDVKRGIYEDGEWTTSNADPPGPNYKDTQVKIIGADGMGSGETTSTGFYIRKFLDPSTPTGNVASGRSTTHWIEIRLAEMYLTCAEAAAETGDADKLTYANPLIRELRDRAGAFDFGPNYITGDDSGIQKVRKEWGMEMMGEAKTYWNYKRWRTFHEVIDNFFTRRLYPWYDISTGKWMFREEKPSNTRTFATKNYYLKVPQGERDKNENLEQNPGY